MGLSRPGLSAKELEVFRNDPQLVKKMSDLVLDAKKPNANVEDLQKRLNEIFPDIEKAVKKGGGNTSGIILDTENGSLSVSGRGNGGELEINNDLLNQIAGPSDPIASADIGPKTNPALAFKI